MGTLKKELGAIYRCIRRWYYLNFRRAYVQEMIAKRKGECGRHGCCDLSMLSGLRRCLDPMDRTKCLRWDNLPFACRVYPFDEKDKIPETRDYCNFYWKDEGG